MSENAKIDYHKNTATRRLTELQEKLGIVFSGLNYLDASQQGGNDLPGFLLNLMVGYGGHIEQAIKSLEALHAAADPSAPEDLPF